MNRLRELAEDYHQHRQVRGYSPHTLKNDRSDITRFLTWLQTTRGVELPETLRSVHLEEYQVHLGNCRTARGLPLKPSSINNTVGIIKGLLRFLAKRGHIPKQLVDAIEYIKEPRLLPTSVLSHKEVKERLLQVDTTTPLGYRDRTMLELLYSSGIRRAELLGLDKHHVDIEKAVAKVMGKGSKERIVPIGSTALRFLESFLKAIRPMWKGSNQTEALFLSTRGRRLSKPGLANVIDRHFGEASVRVTPHTFRRSCTTELVRSNANLYHVKEMLGHESLASLKPYTKLTILDVKRMHARCHPRERD